MRTRRYQPLLEACRDRERLERIVAPQAFVAARVEPGILLQGAACGFDAVFERDGAFAILSGGLFDCAMIAEPEASPFVWPAAATVLTSTLDEIEAMLLPWLLANMLGRPCNDELLRTFGRDDAAFARARAYGFIGAARYATVNEALAPYVLATRYARGRRVGIRALPEGAAGAMLIARSARHVRADLGSDEANAFARRWYGADLFGALEADGYDLAIGTADAIADAPRRVLLDASEGTPVAIARSIPFDVGVSFEPEDSEAARVVGVVAETPPLRAPGPLALASPAGGGSSGRVLFALRNDAERAADADTDDALALAQRLRAEGFTVDVSCGSADPAGYDLVHAFTLPAVSNWWETVELAHRRDIPVVITANADDVAAEGIWGAGMSVMLQSVDTDVAGGGERRALFAARKLESAGLALPRQDPYPEYASRVRRALECAQVTIVRDAREERFLREAFGGARTFAVAPVMLSPHEEPRWPVVAGDGEFVFAHAPLDRRANLLALVRAAMDAKLPLVVAGHAVDVGNLGALRYMADERICTITTAEPAEIEALYRRARVFADVGWYSFGPARQVRAAVSGCALVLARGAYASPLLAPGLWTADPGDERSIAIALGDAWLNAGEPVVDACAARAAAWAEPDRAFNAIVAAYAAATANISPPVAEIV